MTRKGWVRGQTLGMAFMLATAAAFYVVAAIIGPLFVALGLFMVLRPAEAVRRIWWHQDNTKPLRHIDLVWVRGLGCAGLAFSVFWCGSVLWSLVSDA